MDIKHQYIKTEDNEICIEGTEFQCDETKCILSSQVCDGIVDCLDNTDEKECENIHEGWCSPNNTSTIVKMHGVSQSFLTLHLSPKFNC